MTAREPIRAELDDGRKRRQPAHEFSSSLPGCQPGGATPGSGIFSSFRPCVSGSLIYNPFISASASRFFAFVLLCHVLRVTFDGLVVHSLLSIPGTLSLNDGLFVCPQAGISHCPLQPPTARPPWTPGCPRDPTARVRQQVAGVRRKSSSSPRRRNSSYTIGSGTRW